MFRPVRYANPSDDPERFIDSLITEIERLRIDVMLPIADISTLVVTEHRERIERLCRLPFGDADTIARAADKVAVLQTAEALGIPIPRTTLVDTPELSAATLAEVSWPVVVKSRRSRLRTPAGWVACSVSYAATPDEARRGSFASIRPRPTR